jgi:hypothetical protein
VTGPRPSSACLPARKLVASVSRALDQAIGGEGTRGEIIHHPFSPMSDKAKYITAAILVVAAIALGYLVWLQTRLLIITILILAAVIAALYFLLRRR